MLSAKVNSVFNPDFSFETSEPSLQPTNPNKIYGFTKTSNNKSTGEEENVVEDVIDNDDEVESNDESKQELESLIKKKDHVRLKTQSTKV